MQDRRSMRMQPFILPALLLRFPETFIKGKNLFQCLFVMHTGFLNKTSLSDKVLPHLFRPDALETLLYYQAQGAHVVIVTASAAFWIEHWCRIHNFDLIATEYVCKDGKLTGAYNGKNCRGEEKPIRIRTAYKLDSYHTVIAFGDTKDDRPMLALATHPFYQYFEINKHPPDIS